MMPIMAMMPTIRLTTKTRPRLDRPACTISPADALSPWRCRMTPNVSAPVSTRSEQTLREADRQDQPEMAASAGGGATARMAWTNSTGR